MERRISLHHGRAAADLRHEIDNWLVLEQRRKRRNRSLYEERLCRWARPDGVVLLSPAAPSFDRYRDYRARAAAFNAALTRLLRR